jgi:hypothetical protein
MIKKTAPALFSLLFALALITTPNPSRFIRTTMRLFSAR